MNLWTDGGCDNRARGKHGGWAFVVEHDGEVIDRRYGWELGTTSNRMEMTAAIRAMQYTIDNPAIRGPHAAILYSDSQYLVNGAMDWARRWRRNGWITASGGEVANTDLWRSIMWLVDNTGTRLFWTRGHVGTPLNEAADALCTRAMRRARWRSSRARGIV